MKNKINLMLLYALMLPVSTTAFALGPVDGEIGVAVWANDFDSDLENGDIDAGSLIIHGETWIGEKWGIRGAWFDSDLEGEEFSDQSRLSVVLRRRLLSVSDNTFFAVGGGLERLELENGSDSDGFRLSAEGRLGFGFVFVFGRAAWIPELDDAGSFSDVSATELDVGVHITPFPFVSLRAGYLEYDLDYDVGPVSAGSNTSGYYIGAGFHW